MAYTIDNNYTGNGTTRLYSFTFPYLEDTDIKVTLNEVATTNFELANATQINFTADAGGATSTQEASGAPKSSVKIRIYRDTNIDNLQGEFFSGSAIRAQDLNNDFNQTLYVAQETQDKVQAIWNDTEETLDSTEDFIDSDNYIMTAAAIDDRIIAKQAAHALTDARIWVGNGSNVAIAVAPSGDVNMANTGAFTIANLAVERGMIANDAVNGSKIDNDSIDSEHIANGSIDLAHMSVDSVDSAQLLNNSVITTKIANANVTLEKIENVASTRLIVGNGSNRPTAVAVSGDVAIASDGATTIQANAVEIGMIGCEQTTISDSDSHIPTSGAVVDYVAAQLAPVGGLEVIATDAAFPNTQPASGVVISIADAGGVVVNGSGTSTTGRTVGGSTVTINNINSQFNSSTVTNGVSFMVTSTGSGHIYNFHKATLRTEDILAISTDIDDFANRYRVGSNRTANNHSSNDDGDLWFDTGSDKMYVYNGDPSSGGEWQEVASAGDFKLLTIKDHDQASGGSGPTFNGSNEEFDLFDGSSDASITSPGQLVVVLNGVVQKPNTGTFDGSEEGFYLNDTHGIKFCDPPPTGSVLFVTQIGSSVSLNEPADDSVSGGKIQSGAITNAKVDASAAIAGTKISPNFGNQDVIVNTDALFVDASDKEVGIGTNAPEYALHIKDDGLARLRMECTSTSSNSYSSLNMKTPISEWSIYTEASGSANYLKIFDVGNSTNRLKIDDDGHIEIPADGQKVKFGASADLQIHHNSNTNWIETHNDNALKITKGANSENIATFTPDGSVILYHNNVVKAQTYADGWEVRGDFWIDNQTNTGRDVWFDESADKFRFYDNVKATFGTSDDCAIYHDGSHTYMLESGTGHLLIGSSLTHITNAAGNENCAKFIENGAAELYYDNVKKFETTTNGGTFNVGTGEVDILSTGSGDKRTLRLLNADASTSNKVGIYFGPANNVAGAGIFGLAEADFSSDANRDGALCFETRLNGTWGEHIRLKPNGMCHFSNNTADSSVYGLNDYHSFHSDDSSTVMVMENSHDSSPYGLKIDFDDCSPDNNSNYFIKCRDSTTNRFLVYSDGDGWNHDHSWSSSDATLKENIVDVSSKLEDIKKLKVRNFNWKADYYPEKSKKKMIGFIAQEVETVFPGLVSEHNISIDDDNPVMKKSIKQAWSPIIIKALQEAIAKIETLETKVAALEAA